MKAHRLAAFGGAGITLDRQQVAEAGSEGDSADRRRGGSAMTREQVSAAPDFALAMRRVEAECYDSL